MLPPFVPKHFVIHREYVTGSMEARVLALVGHDAIRILVGVGFGQLDGGAPHTLALDEVPPDLRLPNTAFWVTLSG